MNDLKNYAELATCTCNDCGYPAYTWVDVDGVPTPLECQECDSGMLVFYAKGDVRKDIMYNGRPVDVDADDSDDDSTDASDSWWDRVDEDEPVDNAGWGTLTARPSYKRARDDDLPPPPAAKRPNSATFIDLTKDEEDEEILPIHPFYTSNKTKKTLPNAGKPQPLPKPCIVPPPPLVQRTEKVILADMKDGQFMKYVIRDLLS